MGKDKPIKGKGAKETPVVVAPGPEPLRPANALKLRHILCEKLSKNLEAENELKAGVPFHDVAARYSEDKARTGGNLGWMVRNSMMAEFQAECFDMYPSTTAHPDWKTIKTTHGYHLVIVEERAH